MKQYALAIIAVAILAIAVGGFVYVGRFSSNSGIATQPATTPKQTSVIREFTITGSSFHFSPESLTVNKGDTVRLTFVNQGGSHSLCVQGKGCTRIIATGQSDSIEFLADQTGPLVFYCGVDGHRDLGMHGTIIVQ